MRCDAEELACALLAASVSGLRLPVLRTWDAAALAALPMIKGIVCVIDDLSASFLLVLIGSAA